ncbi:MAG: hypothetical protein IPM54_23820 [Polyangiaceae bacterium]|nr:hypothetical protein [Polyangiaceae bacterium]
MKTNEPTAFQSPSEGARQHEREALELYRFIADGRGGSEEAEALRDVMVLSWDAMSSSEQSLLRGLYRDLHMLTGDEVLDSDAVDYQELKKAVQCKQYVRALELLRKRRDKLEPPYVAYFRARCWNALGYRHAGLAFMEQAARLKPNNANYTYLVFQALLDLGELSDALARATALESGPDAKSPALFGAAHALLHATQAGQLDEPGTYERINNLLDRAIALESARPLEAQSNALIVQGYMEKGLCYEHMNELSRAIEAYTAALRQDPDNDAAYVARGLARLDSDSRAAEQDFERAVHLGTPFIWPYMILAPQRLASGEYKACVKICQMAIRRTSAPEHLANLFEWMAIANANLMSNPAIVERFFQRALEMDPLNERIRMNFEVYQNQVAYHVKTLARGLTAVPWEVANDVSPADARASHNRSVVDRGRALLEAA